MQESYETADGVPVFEKASTKAMRKIVNPEVTSTWEDAWKIDATPWNAGAVQPPLKELIENNSGGIEWPKTGRALVPGCGAGHDVVYLASALGLRAMGLDASKTAVDKATASIKEKPLPKGEATFEVTDFFTYKPAERFNLVYDYTFFVAIPPTLRNDWGMKMAELINPGGFLITLAFPIEPYSEGGPPYYVRAEHYDGPLGSAFEKVIDRVPETSAPAHVGKERLLVWKRKGNHN